MMDRQKLHDRITQMSPDELVDAVYRDQLTGLWNRRAFEEAPHSNFVAIIDADSLKWINDHIGHRAGDKLLIEVARMLSDRFGDRAYRLSGDEFVVTADYHAQLTAGLMVKHRPYSFGVGTDLVRADQALQADKAIRELTGARSSRGERPAFYSNQLLTLGSSIV